MQSNPCTHPRAWSKSNPTGGFQDSGIAGVWLELKTCPDCGSTLSLPVDAAGKRIDASCFSVMEDVYDVARKHPQGPAVSQ